MNSLKKREAFTHNISARGVQLEVASLEESLIDDLYNGVIKIGLEIRLPGDQQVIRALAKVAWLTRAFQDSDSATSRFIMGLDFMDITSSDQDRIKKFVIDSYLK